MTVMPESFDLIIRNGMMIDGSGLPRRRVDVGIRDGRVAKLAHLDHATGTEEIDAMGQIVAPGIVDPHTHYDPQITFDPYATMSCFHGVTTVLAGNCGFSVAPCKNSDVDFLKGIFARVEDMDPIALNAVRWDEFETFDQFLATRSGRLGVNLACYIGHSNLRIWVMGQDAHRRAATDDEIEEMCRILARALEAGAAGLSSSASPTQLDIHGNPVPSRLAEKREILALAEVMGRHGRGSISYLPYGAMGGLTDEDKQLLIDIGSRAGVPVVIQGLGGRSKVDVPGIAGWDETVAFLDRAVDEGASIFSMLIARPFDRPVVFDETNFHYPAVPSWHAMMRMPLDQRRQLIRDPRARAEMRIAVENYNRDPARGTTLVPPQWPSLFVDQVALDRNRALVERDVASIAIETGKTPADVVLDILDEENFVTTFRWRTESDSWREAVQMSMHDPRLIIGTSDGGAHLAKDDGSDWSSYFLGAWVRERKEWTLEEGIRQITQIPAMLIGASDRGAIRVGGPADIMIFDPDTIGIWRKEFAMDLPGGIGRYKAWGKGVTATIVNGQPIVLNGVLTNRLPGQVVKPV